jgi:hypothetical protein
LPLLGIRPASYSTKWPHHLFGSAARVIAEHLSGPYHGARVHMPDCRRNGQMYRPRTPRMPYRF